jgi:hypothetical protein
MEKIELSITPFKREELKNLMGEDYSMIDNATVHGVRVSMDFHIEDVQRYLINRGYKLLVLSGKAHVQDVKHSQDETTYGHKYVSNNRKRLIAIKSRLLTSSVDSNEIPEFVDSDQAKKMDYKTVFARLMREQLLGFEPKE